MKSWLVRTLLTSSWLLVPIGSLSRLAAQDVRETMVSDYLKQRQKNPAFYQSPPITHIVPNFNTITYSGNVELQDVTIYPGDENGNRLESPYADGSLKLSGYSVSPHIAMSLKRVGLGFSVESLHREANYEAHTYSGTGELVQTSKQKSQVDASGYGLNFSLLPIPKLSKNIKLALILGAKSLNVQHKLGYFTQVSSASESNTSPVLDGEIVRYSVQQYELGLNCSFNLLKSFRVIPWADYTYTGVNPNSLANQYQAESFGNDLNLFWHDNPKFRYGLDVALYMGGFEVRIGGLLGSLANLNATPSFLIDKTLLFSLSWDQKGS